MLESFATPWTVVHHPPLSAEFPRQECWSRLPFPSPWDLLHPGTEPECPALAAIFLTLSHLEGPYIQILWNAGVIHSTSGIVRLKFSFDPCTISEFTHAFLDRQTEISK